MTDFEATVTANFPAAMQPTSEPVIQEQPDALQYGLDAIALFPQETRRSFELKWGVQPKPFDPNRFIQTWFDTTSPGESRTYHNLTPRGLETFTLSGSERATPNLPGQYEYPKPSYAPTAAYQITPDGRQELIAPHMLTTEEEAEQLLKEIGGDSVREYQVPMYPFIYPPVEKRRIHTIIRDGNSFSAWLVRTAKTSSGVGAPGHWDLTDSEHVRWIAGPFPDGRDARDYEFVPVRELLPNETVVTIFGGLAAIRRKDLAPADGFNAADREKLDAIYQKLIHDG